MSRSRKPPTPTFRSWPDGSVGIRHHETNESVGSVTPPAAANTWQVSWKHYLPTSSHEGPLQAIAAASSAYTDYLAAEDDEFREARKEWAYEDRFLRRQAGAVARAIRIPTGGQKRPPQPPGPKQ